MREVRHLEHEVTLLQLPDSELVLQTGKLAPKACNVRHQSRRIFATCFRGPDLLGGRVALRLQFLCP